MVEVISPSTASPDRGEKKAIYERNGVREYWLVDPRARELTMFVLVEERYDAGQVYGETDVLESECLAGLRVPVSELLP